MKCLELAFRLVRIFRGSIQEVTTPSHQLAKAPKLFALAMRSRAPNRPAMDKVQAAKPIYVHRPNDGFQMVGHSCADFIEFLDHVIFLLSVP